MNNNLYDMIFKRKSFHLFRNIGDEHIKEEELKDIEEYFKNINTNLYHKYSYYNFLYIFLSCTFKKSMFIIVGERMTIYDF